MFCYFLSLSINCLSCLTNNGIHNNNNKNNSNNCFGMPTLLYTLRSSERSDNLILDQSFQSLRDGLTKMLNIDLGDDKWRKVNLPVRFGGLKIMRARTLAPSALSASAASTSSLQNTVLPGPFRVMKDTAFDSTLFIWSRLS